MASFASLILKFFGDRLDFVACTEIQHRIHRRRALRTGLTLIDLCLRSAAGVDSLDLRKNADRVETSLRR